LRAGRGTAREARGEEKSRSQEAGVTH
jgi:hypothetical protein